MSVMTLFLIGVSVLFIGYGLITFYLITRHPRNNPKKYLHKTSALSGAQKKKFVLIGDSLTHGTLSVNYVDLLSKRLNREQLLVDVINAGINGDHAFHVLDRVTDIIRCHPDFITILIGTNDAASSIDSNDSYDFFWWKKLPQPSTLAFFTSNLQFLVSRLKSETDAKIALLSIPPIGEDLNHPVAKASIAFNEAIQDIAERLSVDYLPLHEVMIEYLKQHPAQSKYRYEERNIVFMKSLFRRLLGSTPQQISEKVGFRLHIDFLHLNRTGAAMIVDIIEEFYQKY